MDTLSIIDVDIEKDIVDIYEELNKLPPRKYKKDKATYEEYVSSITSHNDEVNLINSLVDAWDIELFKKDPINYDKESLNRLIEAAKLLKKYKKLDVKYTSYMNELFMIENHYEDICKEYQAYIKYNEFFDIPTNQYINAKMKREILKLCSSLFKEIGGKAYLYKFHKHKNIDEFIKEHNDEYYKDHLNLTLFDNVNGYSLDIEQRKAVLADEDSVLVIAGAGSGKTLTICGKVKYLLEEKKVKPEDILLLSYSKKSADDLEKKVSKIDERLSVGTFHKIGLDILKDTQHKTFMIEEQYKAIIEAYFRESIKSRPEALELLLKYYALYLSSYKHERKYSSKGELYADLKESSFDTLKDQLLSFTNGFEAKETIKKELVKSFEEMAIANWYFINGIDYIYEGPYEHDLSSQTYRQYMPDFKLEKYPIYHEHYGIDKDGHANQYEKEEAREYINTMLWKRKVHSLFNTDCIETYSYEFEDGTIFTKLETELKNRGVEFHPLTTEQIAEALESIYDNRPFKSFINLIRTFLSLYKSSYQDDSKFEELKNSEFRNGYEKYRAGLFLDIVKDVYHYYMDNLRGSGKIDFDDMILQSTNELDNTSGYSYKYIIVDEFQDISFSRMLFLKRLIKQGNARLFAVGDDWQAIYRFSGCDLNIFLKFGSYFGDSASLAITTTHRNSQELQDITGPFIRKNPEQIDKVINSSRHLDHPVQIMYYVNNKYSAFLNVLHHISNFKKDASVLILGRNNKDFEDIELDKRVYIDHHLSDENHIVVKCTLYPDMKLSYSTVHGSKGLEDDFVILINADDNRIGFPNKMEDDELLDLVLSSKSEYEYAEERRLWYVALTRTKNYTYIIADINNPSVFLKEIDEQCTIMNDDDEIEEYSTELLCPHCKTGRLIYRQSEKDGNEFYGCSNYPYCDYLIDDFDAVKENKRCPNCNDFMILRKGQHGYFYGCHSYPICRHTERYEKKW